MMKVSSKVREKSSCSSVGASDGGSETMPENVASPNGRPISETIEDADQRAADDVARVQCDDQHEAGQA